MSNCLFGLAPYDGGEIILHGRQVRFNHPLDAMQSGVILVPENRSENGIFLAPEPDNQPDHRHPVPLSEQPGSERVVHAPADGGIYPAPGYPPGAVQGHPAFLFRGVTSRRFFCPVSFMCRAGIYIMDEPTRGVDAAAKVDIYNSINDLIGKGASVILISSEIEEILGMCDRVLVLAGGRIACDLPREEATKEIILDYATSEE